MTSIQVTVCLVLLGVFSVIFGALSDTLSLKRLFLLGYVVLGIGSVVGFVFQSSFYGVVAGRLLQTVGQASFGSLYLVLVSRYIDKDEKIKYYALFSGSFQLAQIIGVFCGGFISTYIHWKILFVIPLVVFLVLPLILKNLPEEEQKERGHIDVCGIGLLSITILLIILSLDFKLPLLMAVAVIVGVGFFLYISKKKDAFITIDFFKNPAYVWGIVAEFFVFSAQFAFPFIYSFVINGIYGKTLDMVSYVLLPGYCASAVVCLFFLTKIVKRFKNLGTLLIGAGTITAGLILTALILPSGLIGLAIAGVIVMVGYAVVYSPMVDTIVGTLDEAHLGCGIGLNDMIINVSGSLGITVVSSLMSGIKLESYATAMDAIAHYQWIFAGMAVAIFVSVLVLVLKKKTIYRQ